MPGIFDVGGSAARLWLKMDIDADLPTIRAVRRDGDVGFLSTAALTEQRSLSRRACRWRTASPLTRITRCFDHPITQATTLKLAKRFGNNASQ